jgi:hypothetical protein
MLAMLLMSAVPAMASHDGECDDWDWDADEEEWVCVDEDDDGDDGDDEDFDDEDFEGIELADFDLEVVCFLDADFDGLSDEDWADGWDNDWDGEIDEDDIDCFVTAD